MQQCGEGAVLAGASWKGTLNGCSVQYRCSLVEEVVPECREVERQECRLKEQECSSVEREQCWLGPVGREVSLIKLLLSTVKEK